ncbi:MAG: glycosyltransferase [Blautia sp.]|nr:glycosyltransferase [Blautia sp.]
MGPLVSVIVPLYNCGQYIEKCIYSIIGQSYPNLEVIVVDDGSTDNGGAVVQKLCELSSKVQYIYQNNQGVAKARNTALQMAKGKYLLFVDADDYIDMDYIEGMVKCAERKKSDLVIGGYTIEYLKGRRSKAVIPGVYRRLEHEEWVYRISSTCSRLYLKEFWDDYHLEFVTEKGARAEDVPIVLFSNAIARHIGVLQNAGYHYVQRANSAMNSLAVHHKDKKAVFLFPYKAFQKMYQEVVAISPENSRVYFHMGILKALAHFEFVIYRNAASEEKENFSAYVCELLKNDFKDIKDDWKAVRKKCDLPFVIKRAIDLFVLKYSRILLKKK